MIFKIFKWVVFSILVWVFLFAIWPVKKKTFNSTAISSVKIYDRNNILLREQLSPQQGYAEWISLDQAPKHFVNALVSAEDKRFFYHWGIDVKALTRAIFDNLTNREIVSGASTITQQTARLVYNLPRRWYYKPVNFLQAVRLEVWLSKSEILEIYINRLPFGNMSIGLKAASQLYFGKPPAHLSLAESAFLAGLPQAPGRFNPHNNFEAAKEKQELVLTRMLNNGYISQQQCEVACASDIKIESIERAFKAPHFIQNILSKKIDQPEIRTTLDYPTQQKIEWLTKGHIDRLGDYNVTNAAVLVIDNRSFEIVSWIGSKDFFDENNGGQNDGVLALRQPGSTLKPFTYTLALSAGMTPASVLPDIPTHAAEFGGDFFVQNYDKKYHGPVRLRTALACSYNVPAVRVLQQYGSEILLNMLHLLGFNHLTKPASFYGLGLTLGNGEVSLLELTTAYSALANRGEIISPTFLKNDTTESHTIFPSDIAYLITHILSDDNARQPAFGYNSPLSLPFDCAAKTGTSKDFRDNWTVGYTTDYTVGVWVGNFDNSPMHQISGITGAAPLFRDVMLLLHNDALPDNFDEPENFITINVCEKSGELPTDHCPTIAEKFIKGTKPVDSCAVHVQYKIDKRTALLANKNTPEKFVIEQMYEIWPPEYAQWMTENDIPQPPKMTTTLNPNAGIYIKFPDDGDVFKMDPVLPAEFQSLEFQAMVPGWVKQISWVVDDSVVTKNRPPFSYRWTLVKGEHTLYIKADSLQSKKITFTVLP